MIFFVLFVIPLTLIILSFFFSKKISLKELVCQIGIQVIIAGICAVVCYYSNVMDVETWNGTVVNKVRNKTSCSHSYPCNPHNCMCDKDGVCSTCYDTCYHHPYDIEWNVITSNSETISIDTLDSQGLREPPRWSQVSIGEPTAISHRYVSYIKGDSASLFRRSGHVNSFTEELP